MNGSQYERELKGILEGENKILSKITNTCTAIEKDNYLKINDKPFAVIRAAGSLGVDLVAVRGDISFLIEVKTRDVCEKTKTLPIYAFRLKNHRGDSWRIFTLDINNLEGRSSVLHKRVPRFDCSKSGNFVMRWKKGLPLSDFILYLCR